MVRNLIILILIIGVGAIGYNFVSNKMKAKEAQSIWEKDPDEAPLTNTDYEQLVEEFQKTKSPTDSEGDKISQDLVMSAADFEKGYIDAINTAESTEDKCMLIQMLGKTTNTPRTLKLLEHYEFAEKSFYRSCALIAMGQTREEKYIPKFMKYAENPDFAIAEIAVYSLNVYPKRDEYFETLLKGNLPARNKQLVERVKTENLLEQQEKSNMNPVNY